MMHSIWAVLGILSGGIFVHFTGKFNPVAEKKILSRGLIIAATMYILFALIWGSAKWVGVETLGVLLYIPFIILGKRHHFAWIGFGWLLHPAWDFGLHFFGAGKGVAPMWYVTSCITFDILVAAYIFYKVIKLKKVQP
ncbi:MAG: DUF6010 family protein [Bacteroidota bacterium]